VENLCFGSTKPADRWHVLGNVDKLHKYFMVLGFWAGDVMAYL
jgi:hypothetical protein